MNRLESTHIFPKKKIIINSFIGGIFWGAGSVIGAAAIILIVGIIAAKVNLIPYVGNFISDVLLYIENQKLNSPINLPQSVPANP